jgi:hypothetical protein
MTENPIPLGPTPLTLVLIPTVVDADRAARRVERDLPLRWSL